MLRMHSQLVGYEMLLARWDSELFDEDESGG
jgi:hypothetical protein